MEKRLSTKQRRNTMKFWKCSWCNHVAVCTFQNRDSGNPLQPEENNGTSSHLINVPQNYLIFLQTTRTKVGLADEKNCQTFGILFHNWSQLSYISPQAAKNINLKSLGKKDIVVEIFGNVKALKKLGMVQLALKSKDEYLYKCLCYWHMLPGRTSTNWFSKKKLLSFTITWFSG